MHLSRNNAIICTWDGGIASNGNCSMLYMTNNAYAYMINGIVDNVRVRNDTLLIPQILHISNYDIVLIPTVDLSLFRHL